MLELYCELLIARSQLLETNFTNPTTIADTASSAALSKNRAKSSPSTLLPPPAIHDPGLDEAIRSLIFAAPRTDIKELMQVRALLLEKFGKEIGFQAMDGIGVAERVLKKLRVETPATSLVDAYLGEIARTYGISWEEDDDDDDEEDCSGSKEGSVSTENLVRKSKVPSEIIREPRDVDEQGRIYCATSPPCGAVTDNPSPLHIHPPSPSTENAHPRLKMPVAPGIQSREGKLAKRSKGHWRNVDGEVEEKGRDMKTETRERKGDVDSNIYSEAEGSVPDVDELARRFSELKR